MSYAVIPEKVRHAKNLTYKDKIIYSEISALLNLNGYCNASNSKIASLYGVNKAVVSRCIEKLVKSGYVKRKMIYAEDSKQILERRLWLL